MDSIQNDGVTRLQGSSRAAAKTGTVHQVRSPGHTDLIRHPPKSSFLAPALNILANLAFATLLAVVVFVQINLTKAGILTPGERTIYVTTLAIIGALLSHFSTSQLRDLWLRRCDSLLSSAHDYHNVDPLWQVTVGTASIAYQLRYWKVTTTFFVSGLLTTAIVAGFTSTTSSMEQPTEYAIADDAGYVCVMSTDVSLGQPSWKLDNGSELYVPYATEFCPETLSLNLMGSINVVDPDNYGYSDLGVAVRRSALGAPASLYSSGAPAGLSFPAENGHIVSTSQCVPVITKNPFQCRGSSDVELSSGGYLSVTSNNCTASLAVPNDASAGIISQICTSGSVGQATIVMAAAGGHAFYLSEAVGDADFLHNLDLHTPTGNTLYTAICDVDARDALAYRNILLRISDTTGTTGALARSLQADPSSPSSDCYPQRSLTSTPYPNTNTDKLKAIAVTAPFFPLYHQLPSTALNLIINTLPAVFPSTGGDHRLYVRTAPFAFANSPNALSDVLGLTAALVLSRVTITGYSGIVACQGRMQVATSRVGTGGTWALVFTLPPLGVAGSVLWLAVLAWRTREAPVRTRGLADMAELLRG